MSNHGDRDPIIERPDADAECDEDEVEKHDSCAVNPTWRHYLIGPVLVLYMVSMMLFFLSTMFYIPQFIKEQKYPNESNTNATEGSVCYQNKSSIEYTHQQNVTEDAAIWNIYFTLAAGIPSIIATIVLGSHTDTMGRKSLLTLCCLGLLTNILLSSMCVIQQLPLVYFIIGYVIEGGTGGFVNVFQASFSYMADITRVGKSRSFGIALLELAPAIAVVFTSLVTGYYIQAYGYIYPYITTALLTILNLALIHFGLPETVGMEIRERRKPLCQNVKNVFSFFIEKSSTGGWKYFVAICAFFLAATTVLGGTTVGTLYKLDSPFCWNPGKIGLYESVTTVLQLICAILLVKGLQRWFPEEVIGAIGSASAVVSAVLVASARSDVMLYLAPVGGICSNVTLPMIRAFMSKMAPQDKQGALFASIAAVETVCNMVSGLMISAIFAATVKMYSGFVFFVMAGYNAIAGILLISLFIIPKLTRKMKKRPGTDVQPDGIEPAVNSY
ncbi:hypothetical protein ScPMuIL_014162 [Solemya velum]